MSDQERSAMQQALEALELMVVDVKTTPTAYEAQRQAITALSAALAQPPEPVQEPVAWIQPDHLQKARVAPFLCRVEPTQRCADFVPLYTAPLQSPPLTDEEITYAVREADLDWQAGWTLDEHEPNRFTTLARAVERKVRGE